MLVIAKFHINLIITTEIVRAELLIGICLFHMCSFVRVHDSATVAFGLIINRSHLNHTLRTYVCVVWFLFFFFSLLYTWNILWSRHLLHRTGFSFFLFLINFMFYVYVFFIQRAFFTWLWGRFHENILFFIILLVFFLLFHFIVLGGCVCVCVWLCENFILFLSM